MTADLELHEAMQDDLAGRLRAEQESNLLLVEALAELEAEDRGWARPDQVGAEEFTRDGIVGIAARSRLAYLANPLIRRAVNVRTFYTWGQGVEIQARDEQVNELVQAFLDDPLNAAVLFGHDARLERDHDLQLEGNLVLALFTSPLTGRVQVRVLPFAELTDKISDPEDSAAVRFYRREWTANVIDPATGRTSAQRMRALYPDISYRPRLRQRMIGDTEVRWDSPILHVRVGGLGGMTWGVSEVYAATPWARAYRGFLEDWAGLAKALSRFAWKGKTKTGRVRALRDTLQGPTGPGQPQTPAGQGFVSDEATDLTPISKTGATLDADSGRPLAMMVSAAMDIPYTILMGDADIGNRATATTLDRPTELAMQSRREMWAGIYRTLFDYVVDQAVKATQGPLRGTVRRPPEHPDREVIELAADQDRNVDLTFPSILEHDVLQMVQAIVDADGTGHLPAEVVVRLLLAALDVENIDEIMEELLDPETGEFRDPGVAAQASAGQAAVDAFRQGQDPAALLR